MESQSFDAYSWSVCKRNALRLFNYLMPDLFKQWEFFLKHSNCYFEVVPSDNSNFSCLLSNGFLSPELNNCYARFFGESLGMIYLDSVRINKQGWAYNFLQCNSFYFDFFDKTFLPNMGLTIYVIHNICYIVYRDKCILNGLNEDLCRSFLKDLNITSYKFKDFFLMGIEELSIFLDSDVFNKTISPFVKFNRHDIFSKDNKELLFPMKLYLFCFPREPENIEEQLCLDNNPLGFFKYRIGYLNSDCNLFELINDNRILRYDSEWPFEYFIKF